MASVKVTFSLDQQTVTRLNQTAERLHKSKSEIVREAVEDYADRVGRLSEAERRRLLEAFDDLVPAIRERPLSEVEQEISEIRKARRDSGRISPTA